LETGLAATVDELVGALDPDPDDCVEAGFDGTGAGETVVGVAVVTVDADAADDAALEEAVLVDASTAPAANGSRTGPVAAGCGRSAAAPFAAPASAAAVGP
jgi:hypothetical protein